MLAYLIRRLLFAVVVIVGVATISFALLHLIPGSPVDAILGNEATPAARAALEQQLGLDKPVGVCGEAAADPALACVLTGLGVSSLSMTPRAIPDVADVLRKRVEGATGAASQPQVHFELRKGSRPVDPTEYMSDAAASAD